MHNAGYGPKEPVVKILAIGDVFGSPGLRAVQKWLPRLKEELEASLVVVNVENLHGGRGADPAGVRDILLAGADVLTSGNHIWGHRSHTKLLESEPRLLRPANYPTPCPGRGVGVFNTIEGLRVGVVNLMGRIFLQPVDDPFGIAEEIIGQLDGRCEAVVVDFHAEATSEKLALATVLDGKAAAVFGTHTHVQTADARLLPGGTGFITDLGMTGPYDSVIGMETAAAIKRFRTARPVRNIPASGGIGLRGALFDVDEATGHCHGVTRVSRGAGGE